MAIRFVDTAMTSDRNPHRADLSPGEGWRVSWLPGQLLTCDEARYAMTVAELVTDYRQFPHYPWVWPDLCGWAALVGLSAEDAIGLVSIPVTEG